MRAFTLAQRPALKTELEKLDCLWPEFMFHGDMQNLDDFSNFDEYQFAFINESGQVIAGAQTLPFHWSGVTEDLPETMDAVMQNALAHREASVATSAPVTQRANYLCAVAATVDEAARGQGMSRTILLEMKGLARRNGLLGMVAPVRPTFKPKHPELSIDEYADWRLE